jgi:hypothetical protein
MSGISIAHTALDHFKEDEDGNQPSIGNMK